MGWIHADDEYGLGGRSDSCLAAPSVNVVGAHRPHSIMFVVTEEVCVSQGCDGSLWLVRRGASPEMPWTKVKALDRLGEFMDSPAVELTADTWKGINQVVRAADQSR